MDNVLDILLRTELPKSRAKKQVKMLRLSKLAGADVEFTLSELTYNQVEEIRQLHEDDTQIFTVLEGVTEPKFGSKALMDKLHAATPADAVAELLLPGEIDDLAREIERLSGYRIDVLEEVKKK